MVAAKWLVGLLFVMPLLAGAQDPAAMDPAEKARAWEIIRVQLDREPDVGGKARVLCDLAWPDAPVDPSVQALARKTIAEYGMHGYAPMRRALARVRPEYRADVVRALIEARSGQTGEVPQEFLVAMEDALWIGTTEAKRLAIEQLGRHQYQITVPAIIDCALEEPELMDAAVRALGEIGVDQSRYFLARVLHENLQGLRERAAVALALSGGRSLEVLRDATRSEQPAVRLAAVRALLPVASPDDLSALYTYVSDHEDDDPDTVESARNTARRLEEMLEAQRAAEASSAGGDF